MDSHRCEPIAHIDQFEVVQIVKSPRELEMIAEIGNNDLEMIVGSVSASNDAETTAEIAIDP